MQCLLRMGLTSVAKSTLGLGFNTKKGQPPALVSPQAPPLPFSPTAF